VGPLRVIVNADDLGMSPAVDAAIFAGLDAGYLTSTTVLANGPTAERALAELAAFPRASVGVHLNLTEFAPLTGSVEHLLGPDGRFDPESCSVGPGDAAAVAVEWAAQIGRVRDAGLRVSHLDSHQHLHQHPALFSVLGGLRERFGIPRIRGMGALRPPHTTLRSRVGAVAQRARADHFIGRLRRDGALTTDGFASVSVFLAHASSSGLPAGWRTVEVMAHPGNPYSPAYADEVTRLAAGALNGLPLRVEPISWWAIT
jgi:predicted glycoside hydrolase/deacetylase ChbG (UPF0249 family)